MCWNIMWTILPIIILFARHTDCVGRWNVFSTNTLLQWVNDSLGHQSDLIERNVAFGVSRSVCKSIHLSMIVKNGAQYPSKQRMSEIKILHERIVKFKDPEKFKELHDWKLLYDMNMAGELSSKGMEEIAELGDRFGRWFKAFLERDPENKKKVEIVTSDDQRSINTSKYFEQGLLYQATGMSEPYRVINKMELDIANNCFNHEKQQVNPRLFEEFYRFSETIEFVEIINSLRRKLGMNTSLTAAEVYLIHEWCAYGTYISNDMTWCHLLSDEERDVLEYGYDILNYYKYSYGHPINSRMMCPLVKSIFDIMDSTMNSSVNYFKEDKGLNPSYTKAKFQFVDDDTLIPLMTALGLFKDAEPLLATNMNKMRGRKFKTSQIASFGSNLAFLIYACDNSRRLALDEFWSGQQEFRIQAFVNENRVPFCDHSFYCLYSSTKQRYNETVEHCNLTKVCGTDPMYMKNLNHLNETKSEGNEGSAQKANVAQRDFTRDNSNNATQNDKRDSANSLYVPYTLYALSCALTFFSFISKIDHM